MDPATPLPSQGLSFFCQIKEVEQGIINLSWLSGGPVACSSLCPWPEDVEFSASRTLTLGHPGNDLSPLSLKSLPEPSQLRTWIPAPGLPALPCHTHVPSGEVSAIWISLGFETMSSSGSPLSMSLRLKMITSVPREQKFLLSARCPLHIPTTPGALELRILGDAGAKPTDHCPQESS